MRIPYGALTFMKKLKSLISKNDGFTMMELIVSMVVLSLILIAVTAVLAPVLQTFERANNLAEANTLLDNLSTIVMNDIANATSIDTDPHSVIIDSYGEPVDVLFIIKTIYYIRYYTDSRGILCKETLGFQEPVLQKDFYKYNGDSTVFQIEAECNVDEDAGLVTVTLTLHASFMRPLDREYTSAPLGLVPRNT